VTSDLRPLTAGSEKILGIQFFNGEPAEAVDQLARTGGYMVVPASPALINLKYDEDYRRALQNADLALADSGLLVILWRIATGHRLRKVSGIAYLKCLLEREDIPGAGNSFWVVGSTAAQDKAVEWFQGRNVHLTRQNFYVVTRRGGSPEDHALLLHLEKERPRHIVIALGPGTQEKLAFYLREYLLYRPNIHCLGAALGFLTGQERPIPEWAEHHNLGWLFRVLSQPRMLLPRLGIAFVLGRMVLKYRSELPPLQERWADV
jgi:N-acetylglucosaminyldiphosphoundecaprenol N-acetyl-beta-D-mannosaminyltransferase